MTIAEAHREAVDRLRAAGVDPGALDARLLIEAATGLDRTHQLAQSGSALDAAAVGRIRELVARRAAREPIAYILGRRAFHRIDVAVGPGVLVPRPETELLVERALRLLPADRPTRVLDIGTGSGCILLAILAARPLASGVGTDASPEALSVAERNAERLGLAGRCGLILTDWARRVEGTFDIVVSNPPYIATADLQGLAPEVRDHEPKGALDGGPDGLRAYRELTVDLERCLAARATALLEIGWDQEAALTAWFVARGLAVDIHRDLAGIGRVLEMRRADLPLSSDGLLSTTRTASRDPS